MNKLVINAIAATCISGLAAAPVAAEEVLFQVDYSDLDIVSAAGEATLSKRIEAGVKSACAKPSTLQVTAMGAWQDCKDAALSSAVEQFTRARAVAVVARQSAHA